MVWYVVKKPPGARPVTMFSSHELDTAFWTTDQKTMPGIDKWAQLAQNWFDSFARNPKVYTYCIRLLLEYLTCPFGDETMLKKGMPKAQKPSFQREEDMSAFELDAEGIV